VLPTTQDAPVPVFSVPAYGSTALFACPLTLFLAPFIVFA
jgi:hypothetical protein